MSNWKQTIVDLFINVMRLMLRVCLFLNCLMLALFSIWFCASFLIKLMGWLHRTLFSHDW